MSERSKYLDDQVSEIVKLLFGLSIKEVQDVLSAIQNIIYQNSYNKVIIFESNEITKGVVS